MNIDWDLALKVAIPLSTLLLGRFLDHMFTKKSELVSFVGHVSAFTLPDGQVVYAHSIVVKNTGRKPANNVRIGHTVLPASHTLFPSVPFSVDGAEILIPILVSGEQLTVSYLYFPPLTWNQVNCYTKSDEGFAKVLNVLPTPQPTKWLRLVRGTLVWVGLFAIVYLAVYLTVK